jgi:hypothetical protein
VGDIDAIDVSIVLDRFDDQIYRRIENLLMSGAREQSIKTISLKLREESVVGSFVLPKVFLGKRTNSNQSLRSNRMEVNWTAS